MRISVVSLGDESIVLAVKTVSGGVPGNFVYKTNVLFMFLILFYGAAPVEIKLLFSKCKNPHKTNVRSLSRATLF